MIQNDSSLVEKIAENTTRFRSKMTAAGFTIAGENHPISPGKKWKRFCWYHFQTLHISVMLGDAKLASDFANDMLEKGIYVIGFSFPVVPKGQARIRVQISGAHSVEDIDRTVEAFIEVGKNRKVI